MTNKVFLRPTFYAAEKSVLEHEILFCLNIIIMAIAMLAINGEASCNIRSLIFPLSYPCVCACVCVLSPVHSLYVVDVPHAVSLLLSLL